MVVEHQFVTTLKPVDVLRLSAEFLGRHGFVAQHSTAFSLDGAGWTTIDMRRGKLNLNKTVAILELPQQVRVEWDRGRVLVAASIGDRHSKKKRTELLLSIVNGLENLLLRGMPDQAAAAEWDRIEQKLARSLRRGKLIRRVIIFCVVAAMAMVLFMSLRR